MQEIWRAIKDYEELYQISNLGNIRRIGLYHNTFKGEKIYTKNIKNMKPTEDRGYLKVQLSRNNKRKTKYIHQLVAETFIPNTNNYKEVNHKDSNRLNNCVDNLEWCNRKYNIDYMVKHQEQIKERHERRIEALETIYMLASNQKEVKSNLLLDIISEDLIGDY